MTHLVVFDIDGTLVDSTGFDGPLHADALREIGGRRDHEPAFASFSDAAAIRRCLGC